jgi:transposase-like protein
MTFADYRFKGRHFDRFVVTLCVRWYASYVSYKPSYRDLLEIMAERVLSMAQITISKQPGWLSF